MHLGIFNWNIFKDYFNTIQFYFLLDKYYTPNDDNDTITNNINLFVM